MEDRIVVEGKVYFLRTKKEKDTVVTYISKEVNGTEEQVTILKHKKSKKEKLMKFHKKALSFFFQALQKKEPLSDTVFDEEESGNSSSMDENHAVTQKNSAFNELCNKSLHKEVFACFLLKNNELLNYIREEECTIETDELIIQISRMIDFIRDNRHIDQLIGQWETVTEVYETYQLYCRLIMDNSILVIVSSRRLPVGSMMKINEETKELIEEEFFG